MSGKTLTTLLDSLGQYRIDEDNVKITGDFLGQGGFGDVTLGELLPPDPRAGMLVAVKTLRTTGTKEENEHTAILLARELRVWAAVENPHVVPLIGFHLSETRHVAWFISPYLKYGNIRGYLTERKPDQRTRIRLLHEATKGIAHLHSVNICHGDIKAGNILVDDDYQAKLCDFGLAKMMESAPSGLTTSKGLRGSIRYMAPELLGVNGESVGRTLRSDIWALACAALEILFDMLPYKDTLLEEAVILRIAKGNLPANVADLDISAELSLLLTSCWAAEHERPTAGACAHDLEALLNKQEPMREAVTESLTSSVVKGEDNNDSNSTCNTAVEEDSTGSDDRRTLEKNDKPLPKSEVAPSISGVVDQCRLDLLRHPQGDSGRDTSLHNLGVALQQKFLLQRDRRDLTEAMNVLQEALQLRPKGHPNREPTLHTLGVVHQERFTQLGDGVDLAQAIQLLRESLQLIRQHPGRHFTLHNLGVALQESYTQYNRGPDLVEAVDMLREALQLRPQGSPHRRDTLWSLGHALHSKFRLSDDVSDLNEAISVFGELLGIIPPNGPQGNQVQGALENLLRMSRLRTKR